MSRPLFVFFILVAIAVPSISQGGILDKLPLKKLNPFHKDDLEITSRETYLAEPLQMEGERVCLFPFEMRQGGEPLPPRLAPALAEAMTYLVPKDPTVSLAERPGHHLAEWEAPAFDVHAAMVNAARKRGCTLLLEGVTHRAYRKPGGGYHIDASITLYAVGADGPTLRWRGRKTLDWRRRQPRNECLRLFAENVVLSWLAPDPPEAVAKEKADKQDQEPGQATTLQSKAPSHAATRTLHRRDPLPSFPN